MSETAPAAGVKDLLAAYPLEVRELARKVRGLVLKTLPDPIEMVDRPAKIIGYGFGRGYVDLICTIMPTKSGVNLGIARGARLPDPTGLMEGTGKLHRHVKLASLADLKRPGIKLLLKAAVAAWRERSNAGR